MTASSIELRTNPRLVARAPGWRRLVLHRLEPEEERTLAGEAAGAGLNTVAAPALPYRPFAIEGATPALEAFLAATESRFPALARLLSPLVHPRPPAVFRHARGEVVLDRPLVLGVINVTPDSFSDGGRYARPEDAVEAGLLLAAEGADLLDVGGESTRPGARPVGEQEETDRVLPVIEGLARECPVPVSVDTGKAAVARAALAAGAAVANDVGGFLADPEMAGVAAAAGAGAVLMHMQGTPRTMQEAPRYDDLLFEVTLHLRRGVQAARVAGLAPEQVLVDPGIGFGKTPAANLELLRRLGEIASLGHGVLVGTSRKSFIRAALEAAWAGRALVRAPSLDDARSRIWGTAASVACAVAAGAVAVRVHDVLAMRPVADLAWALRPRWNGEEG